MNDLLSHEQCEEYEALGISDFQLMRKCYADGYEQAIKDIEYIEQSGIVIL